LPDELMEQLGWEIGDEVEWGETTAAYCGIMYI
jgi:antitoxin component of MazEF toxin-antitoxin module